jgi:hypothetical protein
LIAMRNPSAGVAGSPPSQDWPPHPTEHVITSLHSVVQFSPCTEIVSPG